MKPPPLLLGAALLFWGWQTDFFKLALLLAVVLESARVTRLRLEFSDDDFARLWTFCTLVFLGTLVYAFSANEGPSRFMTFFENPNPSNTSSAGNASAQAAAAFFRWMPLTFFPFVSAQNFSAREEIPLSTISLILRLRWKRAKKYGQPLPAMRGINVGYPYFAICLFSASIHDPVSNNFYYWGLCGLLVWALWVARSRRFDAPVWIFTLALAIALGFGGQYGIAQLPGYLGKMNTQWFNQLGRRSTDPKQSHSAMGEIGRLKLSNKIAIRIEPEQGPVPAYLREASYRAYGSKQTWLSGHSDEPITLNQEKDTQTWVLVPGKTNQNAMSISCYLEGGNGVLPLPEDCGQIDNLEAFVLSKNSAGVVLVSGPGLLVFDALYGPGPKMDEGPDESDIAVPDAEKPALTNIVSELQLSSTNLDKVLDAVSSFFQTRFTYGTWQLPEGRKPHDTNDTVLGRFLLKTRHGHCEYFATATTLLLREMHIPTRYTVGYLVHEKSGNGYVVRYRDAHAWCIVWDGHTWRDFDTTPGTWLIEQEKNKPTLQWLLDTWSWITFQFSKFRWGQTHLRQYILIALVPVLLTLLFQIFFRQKRRHQKNPSRETGPATVWPGLDSEFYLVEQRLARRGVPRQPNEPLAGWLERTTHEPALSSLRKPLHDLLRLHYRCRFDPRGLGKSEREELKRGARNVLAGLEND